jgi:hypothetical protein
MSQQRAKQRGRKTQKEPAFSQNVVLPRHKRNFGGEVMLPSLVLGKPVRDITHSSRGFTGLVFSFSLIRPNENGNFSFYRKCAIEFVAAKRKRFTDARFVCHMDRASWDSEGTVRHTL